MHNPKTFIFYGPSGAGKGTQADLLSEYLKAQTPDTEVLHVYPGRLLRSFTKEIETHTSKLTSEVMNEGGLLPVFVPVWAWTNFLIHHFTGNEHLIFDGVARKDVEVEVLDGALKFFDREKPFVINLNVSDDWAQDKLLKRGRKDDNKEDIAERLSWYHEEVKGVLEQYRDSDYYRFLDINGEQTIEEVHQDIASQVKGVE